MAKLWEKNYSLNALIERFTVGNDYLLDRRLIVSDCCASLAHAVMLQSIGVITQGELASLRGALLSLTEEAQAGNFTVGRADEDCHTALENALTERCGAVGKKIHTGRSRNDQVMAALRLFSRDVLLSAMKDNLSLAAELTARAREHEFVPMPGRTHLQIAMPSTVGLYLASFAEELVDYHRLLMTAYEFINRSPLGAAASYGVPLPIDREMTARLLGFQSVQNNVLYVINSRGKGELLILEALDMICLCLSKLAHDLILFSLPEFAYFSLPAELCTGSSIMPQKKNPDVLELVRARSGEVSGTAAAVKNILRSLPSGYQRDFQQTKGQFFYGIDTAIDCIRVMQFTVKNLGINPEKLRGAFTPEIFATDAVYDLVSQGMEFREAYKRIGAGLASVENQDIDAVIRKRSSTGAPGNPGLRALQEKIGVLSAAAAETEAGIRDAVAALAGRPIRFY
jgi:argininosuccinate lyase